MSEPKFGPDDFRKARQLADELIASCDGGASLADRLDEFTLAECLALDSIAFECQDCNQWWPIHDKEEDEDGRWVCHECLGDR